MRKKQYPAFRNFILLLPILPFLFMLCGCPYSSSYKIDNGPVVPTDDSLVGKWATMLLNGAGNNLPIKMAVDKKSDFEYNLYFTGNIKDLEYFNVVKEDTIKGTAFLSEAASRRFLNINVRGQFYIAELIYKNDQITLLPLCEHFTVKVIRSDAELRMALELHYMTRLHPLYDDAFCLKNMARVK